MQRCDMCHGWDYVTLVRVGGRLLAICDKCWEQVRKDGEDRATS